MAGRASMARSWAERTLCSGMVTTSCCQRLWSCSIKQTSCGENMPINRVFDRMRAAVTDPHLRWARDPKLWVEMFATVNLAILAADIFIAHSVNHFTKAAEYIPLYFSLGAPVALAIGMALRWICRIEAPWRDVGYLIGWLSILIGLGGVLYHLESRFFLDRTLKS